MTLAIKPKPAPSEQDITNTLKLIEKDWFERDWRMFPTIRIRKLLHDLLSLTGEAAKDTEQIQNLGK